jgi:hypothetical protein
MARCSSKEAPNMGNAGFDWRVGGMQPPCGRELLAGGTACGEEEADRWPHVKKILGIVLNPDFDYWYRK